jgi:hypothetical protein
VNAPRGTTTEAVADTVLTARDTAGVEEAFVDLMYLTDDTAAASGLVGEILDAVGDR